MNFAYFGRLEHEKGFDYFLELAKTSVKQKQGHNFIIFGEGSLKQQFLFLRNTKQFLDLSKNPNQLIFNTETQNQIIYLGKQDLSSVIQPILTKHIDFTIIPSRMLETFGLTALESLATYTDVITSKQPALEQFNNLNQYISFDLDQDLNLLKLAKKSDKNKITETLQKYSKQNWINKIKEHIPEKCQKILIVSDFKDKLGGAEIHLHQTIQTLKQVGYTIELYSTNKKPSMINQLFAIFNIIENKKFKQTLNLFNPDLIWFHSLQRYFGPLITKSALNHSAKKFITIHDFGLFTEYPSQLTSINQIGNKNTLAGTAKHYLIQKPLLKSINRFDKLFVPSKFLTETLKPHLNITPTTLEHFYD
jgi:glycosyltransferase involved in cell wall biosynthesis